MLRASLLLVVVVPALSHKQLRRGAHRRQLDEAQTVECPSGTYKECGHREYPMCEVRTNLWDGTKEHLPICVPVYTSDDECVGDDGPCAKLFAGTTDPLNGPCTDDPTTGTCAAGCLCRAATSDTPQAQDCYQGRPSPICMAAIMWRSEDLGYGAADVVLGPERTHYCKADCGWWNPSCWACRKACGAPTRGPHKDDPLYGWEKKYCGWWGVPFWSPKTNG